MRKLSIFLFVILTLSADLKVTVFPYIHWIAWLILIFPIMLKDLFVKGIVVSPFLGVSFITFLLGYLTSSFSNYSSDILIQFIKFILIFLTIYFFLNNNSVQIKDMFSVINILVVLNALFLLVGYFGIYPTAQLLTSDGRWGTFFNYPGSLVKIGSFGFFYNVMLIMLVGKGKKTIYIIMIILSVFIVYMDGSRTGMLLLLLSLSLLPILYIVAKNGSRAKIIFISILSAILAFFIVLINIKSIFDSRIGTSISTIINSDSLARGLESIDPARYMMLITAIDKIISNPLTGTGVFTTVGVYSDGTSMVVHNSYLQIWGDFGILGLIGFLLITLSWIWLLPRVFEKMQLVKDAHIKAIVCSSILMLLYFNLNGLFHPYSTEFAEWITFIVPLTAYFTFYKFDWNKTVIHN